MDAIHHKASHNTKNQWIWLNTMQDDPRLDLIYELLSIKIVVEYSWFCPLVQFLKSLFSLFRLTLIQNGKTKLMFGYYSYYMQQPAMGYGDLSHTEVIISHEAKLSGICETEVWNKSHIPWLVVGEVFYSIERQFQTK